MTLSINNFFRYYIFNYNAEELTEKEKNIAKITSIVLGIFTICLVHLICRIAFYDRSFMIKKSSDDPKTSEVSQKILNPTQTTSSTTTPPTEEVKTLPTEKVEPLPFLLNHEINSASPLMNEIPKMAFLRNQENAAALFLGLALTGNKASMEDLFPNQLDDILDISLSHWINENERYNYENENIKDLKNLEKKKMIDERINALESEIQLKERLKRLKSFLDLKVKDLLIGWKESPLKYALMMDDELSQLKFSDIKAFTPELVLKTFGYRVKISKANPAEVTMAKIEDLLLVEAPKLSAEEINKQCTHLLPSVFCLISLGEVSKIDVTSLVKDQLNALFTSKEHVHALKKEQLEYCIPLIENKGLFSHLSDDQVITLDFEKAKIDQKAFMAMLGYTQGGKSSEAGKLVQKLPIEKIYQLAPFFNEIYWGLLSDKQVIDLDFEKAKIDQKAFVAILGYTYGGKLSEAGKLMQKLPIEKIYQLVPFFNEIYWGLLSDEQVIDLDFEKVKIDQKAFVAMFGYTYGVRFSVAAKLLHKLPIEKIYQLTPLFNEIHWRLLSDDQVLKLDFEKAKIDQKAFDAIFSDTRGAGSSEAAKLLQKLSDTQLLQVKDYAIKTRLDYLSKVQKLKLGIS